MKKILLSVCILASFWSYGQFNPEQLDKSLVKVMVSQGGKTSICTGFVWKQPTQIVTSLHVMKPNGQIKIIYQGKVIRTAKILRTHAPSDLVLLQVEGMHPQV